MDCNNSYVIRNPLCSLTTDYISEHLSTKSESLKDSIILDENEFIKSHTNTTIFELSYYDRRKYRTMPYNGWVKPCSRCHSRTSSTIIYCYPNITRYQYFRIYICRECQRHYPSNLLEKTRLFAGKYIRRCGYYVTPSLY